MIFIIVKNAKKILMSLSLDFWEFSNLQIKQGLRLFSVMVRKTPWQFSGWMKKIYTLYKRIMRINSKIYAIRNNFWLLNLELKQKFKHITRLYLLGLGVLTLERQMVCMKWLVNHFWKNSNLKINYNLFNFDI